MRTIELRVTITDAAVDEETTTIFYSPVTRDPRCGVTIGDYVDGTDIGAVVKLTTQPSPG